MELTNRDLELLKRYPRAIYHLRAQLRRAKLMPVFGAGIGKPIGMPTWEELVKRISLHPLVEGHTLIQSPSSQSSRTQLLFQHFRKKYLENLSIKSQATGVQHDIEHIGVGRTIARQWRDIVHASLYETAQSPQSHPYLSDLIPLIRKAPLTVNYNFDDSIQELLFASGTQGEDQRGFETVWDPTVQYRYNAAVIYHPNGYLPRTLESGPSPSLVFAEDSFADQLIDAQRGHYSTLLSHFFRFTSLLIGLSLEDATLKHLLRQSAQANPGHVHYYVAYCKDEPRKYDELQAIQSSNFETYNLVTLFLPSEDIRSLGRLLNVEDREFFLHAEELGLPKAYTFYLTGAVGVGKTTVLNHFKSLSTFEEWIDRKHPLLAKASRSLTPEERRTVNTWIDRQFRRRNSLIRRSEAQVNLVDRSPIDPIAFSHGTEAHRARELQTLYSGVAPGAVILMLGNADVMHVRVIDRHKNGSPEYIRELQERFRGLWSNATAGVTVIDTTDQDIRSVVRRVARTIHLDTYSQADIDSLLRLIVDQGDEQTERS